ncbi:ABC transporter permease [Acetivibrio clariflavus]|uniref:ABC-type transport system, involved in lipoprotein release, permease component n=1 Tax=Acetivibrio clariflavus (strain DSM 19732 / NBRC 101661 / EBR45) TaxID=720554 RepID=G8LW43_ACECE|nr:FtsX-like permease family protein [Acetivibrio clariflavus]AEV68647.1 ABC-type transport system, involved in lipoprotein release, permease component [Acetivibrio clariflavus DSM 19732]
MNIVNRLTLRHLKLNKRRTLVTIIGVIIAVAMITAVTTLGVSFLDLFIRDEINEYGEWHIVYYNVNTEQISAIKEDKNTEAVILSKNIGNAVLEEKSHEKKLYLSIQAYNQTGFEKLPITLISGRFPKEESEIVVSEEIIKKGKMNIQIGDEVTLDIGEIVYQDGGNNNKDLNETFIRRETATYTVVGIIKPLIRQSLYSTISFLDESKLDSTDRVNASVVLNKIKNSLYTHAQEIAEQNNIDSVYFNDNLLRYYGVSKSDNFKQTFIGLLAIIMGIVIIGAVALIYNSFAISVGERSRYLGMLSSVGATKRQKRNSIFFESAVIGLVSIPLGILSGLGGLGLTFLFINQNMLLTNTNEKLLMKVTPESLLLACAVSILTIFISTYLPARRASKVSAIDAIRQTADIKIKGKTVKTSKLVRMLFGIEGEIGLKNLKRNRGRYKATVFSIVTSIILFLSISFFIEHFIKSVELTHRGINYDIKVLDLREDAELKDWLNDRNEITEYAFVREINGTTTWQKEEMVPQKLREELEKDMESDNNYVDDAYAKGKYSFNLYISSLDDEALKAYAETVGADFTELIDPNRLSGILVNKTSYRDYETGKYVETKTTEAKAGDKLDVLSVTIDVENTEEEYIDRIEIAALADERPMGIYDLGISGLSIIVSEATLERLAQETGIDVQQTNLYIKSTDPQATREALEQRTDSNIYNTYESREKGEKILLFVSIFTYGFITLITLISIANIFNTISTSIALRRREFAMLKSIGMTPKGFNKMINYESIFYGLKALLYSLPISGIVMVLLYRAFSRSFDYEFTLPWRSILIAMVSVFIIVGSAMFYSSAKIKKENILDALKQENI